MRLDITIFISNCSIDHVFVCVACLFHYKAQLLIIADSLVVRCQKNTIPNRSHKRLQFDISLVYFWHNDIFVKHLKIDTVLYYPSYTMSDLFVET